MTDVTDFKLLLARVAAGERLDEDAAAAAFDAMMSGNATPAQMGGFLMALRVRGETVAEITGAARTMRAKALAIEAPSGASSLSAFARMTRAAPAISSTVSPRTLSPIRKAPICAGVALPDIMISKAVSASAEASRCPAATLAMSGFRSIGEPVMPPSSGTSPVQP